MNVRDYNRVGPVTHHKVLRSFRDEHNIVNSDVHTLRNVGGFNCAGAVHCLHGPDLVDKPLGEVIQEYKT